MRARVPSAIATRSRRDGWTVERQIGFLAALARGGSVTEAAASVGISRESAYRLRARDSCGLFAALWDQALTPDADSEGHNHVLTDGLLARLLGNAFRRPNNGFVAVAPSARSCRPTHPTRTL